MAEIIQNSSTGGISDNQKVGLPNSYRFSRNMNIFEDANYVTLSPRTVLSSGTNVIDLPLWIVTSNPYTPSDLWAYGDTGNLYRSDGIDLFWNLERNGSTIEHGAAGQGLIVWDDAVYYATATTIGRGIPLSSGVGDIVYDDNFLSDGTTDVNSSQVGVGQIYTTPTTIIEDATDSLFFVANFSPIQKLEVIFGTKGTGTLQVTIEDNNNNVVLFHDVDNTDLPASGDYTFVFDSPWFPIIGETYHLHITSTTGDATLQTGTVNDLSTLNYSLFFNILIDTDYHPIVQFLNGILIGNNNYIASWNGALYNPNQIAIESGYEIRTIAQQNEYVVIGAWHGGDATRAADAKLYFWDGIAPTFNYSVPVEMGFPNALTSSKNRLLGVYGTNGKLFLNSAPFQSLRQIPKLATDQSIEVAPGAITDYRERTVVGFGINTSDFTGVEMGVYEWGTKSDEFPEVFNFPYTISTGSTQGEDLQIGSVASFGTDLYIGWHDGDSYGIDKVAITNDPFPTGTMYSLIFDNGQSQKPKYADILVIEFAPLQAGESITPIYAIDDDAYANNFTLGGTISTVGATEAVLSIGKRFHDISFGFNVTADTTFPKISTWYLLFDPLANERDFGQ